MKSIQMTALILWMAIFIVAAFVLGQFLSSKEIFDITTIISGDSNKDVKNNQNGDEFSNEAIINKIGQETVRVGLNIAKDYFTAYYNEYVNYIMSNDESYPDNEKITINDTLASEYIFYAISSSKDEDKYESLEEEGVVEVTEAEANSFIDKMFGKEIEDAYKKDGKYGYDRINRTYSMEKQGVNQKYTTELKEITNVTSNELVLTYDCKGVSSNSKYENMIESKTIKLTVIYKGGRYIVTEVEK